MATTDYTENGALLGGTKPGNSNERLYVLENTVSLTAAQVTAGAVDSLEVLNVLAIQAGTVVQQVYVEIVTAAGGTLTAVVGITGDDPNGFDNDIDLTDTAGTVTHGAPGTDAYLTAGGKYFSSADSIDLVTTATTPTGPLVLKITAHCIDVSTFT